MLEEDDLIGAFGHQYLTATKGYPVQSLQDFTTYDLINMYYHEDGAIVGYEVNINLNLIVTFGRIFLSLL